MNVGKSTDAFYGVDANGDIADVGSTNNSNWWRKAFASKPALSSRFKTESLDQHICLVSFERATFGDDILRDFRATVLDFSHSGVWVRTLSAILLTITMGLPMAGPLFASGESSVPACCRRSGKHQCMQMMLSSAGAGSQSMPAFSGAGMKCPLLPRVMASSSHRQVGLSTSAAVFAEIVSHPAVSPQSQCNYRVSLGRSHHKRGPPSAVQS